MKRFSPTPTDDHKGLVRRKGTQGMVTSGAPEAFSNDGNGTSNSGIDFYTTLASQNAIRQKALEAQLQAIRQQQAPQLKAVNNTTGDSPNVSSIPTQTPVDYGKVVELYDSYANSKNPSLWDQYNTSFTKWSTRVVGSDLAQNWMEQSKLPMPKSVPVKQIIDPKLAKQIKDSKSIAEMLGIKNGPLTRQEQVQVSSRFEGYLKYCYNRICSGKGISIKSTDSLNAAAKSGFLNNFKPLLTFLENGKLLPAFASMLGLYSFADSVICDTKKGYCRAKQDEVTRHADHWSTLGKTFGALVKAIGKTGGVWEVGRICLAIGSCLFGPFGPLAACVGGIAVAALGSLIAKNGLDFLDRKIFG